MGRKSIRDNKSKYQLSREAADLTRIQASMRMDGISSSRIEKIEGGIPAYPYDIVQMADAYADPALCNYYCSHECDIGKKYVPEIQQSELASIIIETAESLRDMLPLTDRLLQIARDGKVTDDEITDFAKISNRLDDISLAIHSLNLWIDKETARKGIDREKFEREKERSK